MTAALVVLAACYLWTSALALWALTHQIDRADLRTQDALATAAVQEDRRAADARAQHEEAMGLLAEELTANRAAHEDTLRMVLAGYERLVYPSTVPEQSGLVDLTTGLPVGPVYADQYLVDPESGQRRPLFGTPRPNMPDDPAVTGDLDAVVAEEPAFLSMPLDGIPDDDLHAARIEAMYSAPIEPMPEAAGPQGAVMMDVEDPDPFGIGADRDRGGEG